MSKSDRQSYWLGVLEAQKASGVSMTRWCSSNDINLQTFQYWRKKLSASSAVNSVKAVEWATVTNPTKVEGALIADFTSPSTPSFSPLAGHVFVHIGRCSVEVAHGFDPSVLSDVLTVLEARC